MHSYVKILLKLRNIIVLNSRTVNIKSKFAYSKLIFITFNASINKSAGLDEPQRVGFFLLVPHDPNPCVDCLREMFAPGSVADGSTARRLWLGSLCGLFTPWRPWLCDQTVDINSHDGSVITSLSGQRIHWRPRGNVLFPGFAQRWDTLNTLYLSPALVALWAGGCGFGNYHRIFMTSIKAGPVICTFLFIRRRDGRKSRRPWDLDADPEDKLLTSQMYFYISVPLQWFMRRVEYKLHY